MHGYWTTRWGKIVAAKTPGEGGALYDITYGQRSKAGGLAGGATGRRKQTTFVFLYNPAALHGIPRQIAFHVTSGMSRSGWRGDSEEEQDEWREHRGAGSSYELIDMK